MKARELLAWSLVVFVLFGSKAQGLYYRDIAYVLYSIRDALKSSAQAEWQQAYYLKKIAEKP